MDEPAAHPRFSVVVPCYNYGHFLPACVASVLDQDVEVEIVVVEDRSTDSSGEVADALAAQDGRVRVLHNEVNLGLIGTANRGLAEARGEFLVLLSADDLLAPGALARAERLFDAHPTVGLVYGDVEIFTTAAPSPRISKERWYTWPGPRWAREVARAGTNPIFSPEAIIRHKVLDFVGPYRSEFPHTSDLKYWLEASQHGDIARISGPTAAYYRRHGNNMSTTDFGDLTVDAQEKLRTFNSSDTGPDAWDRDIARRSVARELLWQSWAAQGVVGEAVAQRCRDFALTVAPSLGMRARATAMDLIRPSWAPRDVAPRLNTLRMRMLMRARAARAAIGARATPVPTAPRFGAPDGP